jgi:hypothetical protein
VVVKNFRLVALINQEGITGGKLLTIAGITMKKSVGPGV